MTFATAARSGPARKGGTSPDRGTSVSAEPKKANKRANIGHLENMATCSYISPMISTGIRELKNGLSRFVRQAEGGERIAVTAHGRVIAELVPPSRGARVAAGRRYEALVAAGIIEPAAEPDLPPAEWPPIQTPPGTVAQLIDADRGER